MPGRPKLQFTPADGERFWTLAEEVARIRLAKLNRLIEGLARTHPDLQVAPPKTLTAPRLVLRLLEEELRRLRMGGGE